MDKQHNTSNRGSRGKWIIFTLIGLGIAAFFFFDLGQYVTLEALKQNKESLKAYAQENYLLTVLVFIVIYMLQTALSLPGAAILTLAGGFLYGTLWGAIFVNIGATAGAGLAFMAARYLFRDAIEKRFGKRLSGIQEGFTNNGFNYLLTLRLIPLFPFFLVNLASGLTRIKLSTYLLATAIGILPGSLVFTNAGKQIGGINALKDIASPGVLGAFSLLGLLSLVPVVYNKMKKASPEKREVHIAKP
ncbi:MAG: TVP38/TMEM64 family protein [Nitrospiria bacterium]